MDVDNKYQLKFTCLTLKLKDPKHNGETIRTPKPVFSLKDCVNAIQCFSKATEKATNRAALAILETKKERQI